MKLWLVKRLDDVDWDELAAMIVACDTLQEAERIFWDQQGIRGCHTRLSLLDNRFTRFLNKGQ